MLNDNLLPLIFLFFNDIDFQYLYVKILQTNMGDKKMKRQQLISDTLHELEEFFKENKSHTVFEVDLHDRPEFESILVDLEKKYKVTKNETSIVILNNQYKKTKNIF